MLAAIVALAFVAGPIPDLPDPLAPPPDERPPEQAPERGPPKADAPPSAEMTRVCDRMAAPWGSDGASGAPRDPFRGPRRLAGSLSPGQTGCLRGGEYTERELIVRRRKLTLRSAPGERATWRGRIVLAGRRDRLVELNLDGSAGPRGSDGGRSTLPSPTLNAPEVVVSDSDITDRGTGICVSAAKWRGLVPDRFVIQRNRIHDCGRRPPTNHDHGIYVSAGDRGVIRDNVIHGNADRGIQLFPAATRTRVVRNTVDGNGSGVIFSNESARNVVRDNVFTNAVVRWNAESHRLTGRGNRFEANCVRGGNPDPDYNQNGGVMLPPLVAQADNLEPAADPYRDRARGDYRLAPDGPCAGKGAPDPIGQP